jgi:hypothetical protein
MIVLDLGDVPVGSARRIPLASWFRFRRAVEHTPTVLLVVEQQPIAGSCSSVLMKVSGRRSGTKHAAISIQDTGKDLSALNSRLSGNVSVHSELPVHAKLLDEFEITAELLRSRLDRKPAQSATATFRSRAAWAVPSTG